MNTEKASIDEREFTLPLTKPLETQDDKENSSNLAVNDSNYLFPLSFLRV